MVLVVLFIEERESGHTHRRIMDFLDFPGAPGEVFEKHGAINTRLVLARVFRRVRDNEHCHPHQVQFPHGTHKGEGAVQVGLAAGQGERVDAQERDLVLRDPLDERRQVVGQGRRTRLIAYLCRGERRMAGRNLSKPSPVCIEIFLPILNHGPALHATKAGHLAAGAHGRRHREQQ